MSEGRAAVIGFLLGAILVFSTLGILAPAETHTVEYVISTNQTDQTLENGETIPEITLYKDLSTNEKEVFHQAYPDGTAFISAAWEERNSSLGHKFAQIDTIQYGNTNYQIQVTQTKVDKPNKSKRELFQISILCVSILIGIVAVTKAKAILKSIK
jgi:hypothetical protein